LSPLVLSAKLYGNASFANTWTWVKKVFPELQGIYASLEQIAGYVQTGFSKQHLNHNGGKSAVKLLKRVAECGKPDRRDPPKDESNVILLDPRYDDVESACALLGTLTALQACIRPVPLGETRAQVCKRGERGIRKAGVMQIDNAALKYLQSFQ